MAKAPDFSVGTTDLGRSNFQGTVQAGVVDKSKALKAEADFDAMSDAGTLGITEYKKFDESQVLGDVAKEIGSVITEQQDRSLAGQEALEGAILQGQQDQVNLDMQAGYDATYPRMLNQNLSDDSIGIQNALVEQTSKLSNARQQGVMGDLELKERLAKITREAIASNPAYAAEITSHVSAVSDMNNLTARVAEDLSAIKSEKTARDAREKEIRTNAYKLKLFPEDEKYNDNGRINYDLLEQDMSDKFFLNRAFDEIKLENETNSQKEIKDANLLIEEAKPAEMNRVITNQLSDFVTDLENNTTMPLSKKIRAFDNKVRELNFEVNKWYVGSKVSPTNPELKVYEDDRKTQFELIRKSFIGTEDKSLDATQQKNIKEFKDNRAYNILLEKHAQLPIMLQFMELDFSNISGGASLKLKVEKSIVDILGDGMDPDTYLSPKTNAKNQGKLQPFTLKNGKKTSAIAEATNVALKQYLSPNPYNSADNLNERLGSWVNLIEGSSGNTNFAVANLISTLSSPEMGQGMNAIKDPSLISKLSSQVSSYKPILKNAVDSFKSEFPEAKLEVRESDGVLFVSNANAKMNAFINNNLRSINETANAHFNVNKLSPNGKNANAFYAEILGEPNSKKSTEPVVSNESTGNEEPNIIDKIAIVESSNMHMTDGKLTESPKGALGKYQIMPDTAKKPGYGVTPIADLTKASEEEHRVFAESYYQAMLKEFDGEEDKALAAYNGGVGIVKKAIKKDPDNWIALLPKESREYITKVQTA